MEGLEEPRDPDGPAHPSVGVYVHVPFCERVCPYCDFAVEAARPLEASREQRYVEALLRELEARRGAFAERPLASLYLGGGTPSLLAPASVARIVDAVCGAFASGRSDAVEVTLEVNPSTVERARLPGFRDAGVNRVSVGVQSFDDTVLRRLGRAHRAQEGRRTLAACRDAGFTSLSADLIFAAPDQSRAGLERDLDELLEFRPEHVSTYELTVEQGTPFATAAARGQLALPGEEQAASWMERIEERLGAAGLERYEISSHALAGQEAVHNRRYWSRRPVLGLGSGAVSTDPASERAPFGVRRSNPRGVTAYLDAVEAGRPAAADSDVLDASTARGEAAFLALRTREGLEAAMFEAEFGRPPQIFFGEAIERYARGGLLERSPTGDLRLTPRGRLLADTVFAAFV